MKLRSLHLCCGSGGDGRGFADEGFEVTGVDVDRRALDDFGRLTGGEAVYLDLETAQPADLRRAVPRCPHILVISAPCKWASGLMSEDKARTEKYRRLAALTIRSMDLAMTAWDEKPMLVLFENVPRIVSRAKKIAAEDAVTDVLEQVVALLQRSGYATAQRFHDCGEIGGLAQHRKRFLLVARHMETCPDFLREPPKQRVRSIGEELFDMPVPRPDGPYRQHRLNAMSPKNWARIAAVRPGKDWKDIPAEIEIVECDSDEVANIDLRWGECAGRQDGKLGVQDPAAPAHAVIAKAVPTKGWAAVDDHRVADLRPESYAKPNKQNGGFGVEAHDQPAHSVVARASTANTRNSLEDIRLGCRPRAGHYGVNPADTPSTTILGHHKVDQARGAVEELRLGHAPRTGSFGVQDPQAPADTVRGCNSPRQAPGVVADIRVRWDADKRKGRPDCYGVADPQLPSGTIRSRHEIENSRRCVDDGRVSTRRRRQPAHSIEYDDRGWPIPTHAMVRHVDGRVALYGPRLDFKTKKGCYLVIVSIDEATGRRGWHRPMTTDELRKLQSFPDFEFCGPDSSSDAGTGVRERIGNAIPVKTARACAREGRLTVEAALACGFHLSAGDIWVERREEARADG
ncbi:MAG: DNA cytosine methyltransferase [Myxococcales bacterium]|nr:DNA cytosine methyltransferase [Myxococcales bacterium]